MDGPAGTRLLLANCWAGARTPAVDAELEEAWRCENHGTAGRREPGGAECDPARRSWAEAHGPC
jgi:hypothetical protein